MGHVRRDAKTSTGCPQVHKPCPLVFAFLARLTHGMALATDVTGQCPDMTGALWLNDCPLGQRCQLSWHSQDGIVCVHDGVRQLLQMPLCEAGAA